MLFTVSLDGLERKRRAGNQSLSLRKPSLQFQKAIKRRIKVDETIILAELAKRMGIKANEMIAKLMELESWQP